MTELSNSLMRGGYCRRVDNVFFRAGDYGCVQRDLVYHASLRHGLNFELISMDSSYFTGTKNHAMALQEAFGGRIYPSEYVACVEGMDLWVWEGPERTNQLKAHLQGRPYTLDFEAVKAAIFDEV